MKRKKISKWHLRQWMGGLKTTPSDGFSQICGSCIVPQVLSEIPSFESLVVRLVIKALDPLHWHKVT